MISTKRHAAMTDRRRVLSGLGLLTALGASVIAVPVRAEARAETRRTIMRHRERIEAVSYTHLTLPTKRIG